MSDLNIVFRPANTEDVSGLLDLHAQLYEDSHPFDDDLDMDRPHSQQLKDRFDQLVQDPNGFCYVAECDAAAVGYLAGHIVKYSYKKSPMGEIEDMVIKPEYRSRGIGSRLVDYFKVWCKERGVRRIVCDLYEANTAGMKFYQKQGMQRTAAILEADI